MNSLLVADSAFQLFSPLLIGSILVVLVFVLGRLVASRKILRALEDEGEAGVQDCDPDAPVTLFRPRIASQAEVERTREFERSRDLGRPSAPTMDEVTAQFERVYLDASDSIES